MFFLICLAGCASSSTSSNNSPDLNDTKLTAQTYYAAGQLAESQQSWARAINEYRLALAAHGPHTPSLYRIAMIYTELKDYPHAIDAWKQYVSATYGAALAYGDLAHAYELSGKLPEAAQAYQSALQKEPANPTCRVNYGLMLARQNQIPAAEEQLRGILTPAQAHYQIALICQKQKNFPQARAQFTQAVQLDPQLLDAQSRLAELDSSPLVPTK